MNNRVINQLEQTDEFSQLISLHLDSDNPPAGEPHRGHTTVPPADQPNSCGPCCHMTQHAVFALAWHDTHATRKRVKGKLVTRLARRAAGREGFQLACRRNRNGAPCRDARHQPPATRVRPAPWRLSTIFTRLGTSAFAACLRVGRDVHVHRPLAC